MSCRLGVIFLLALYVIAKGNESLLRAVGERRGTARLSLPATLRKRWLRAFQANSLCAQNAYDGFCLKTSVQRIKLSYTHVSQYRLRLLEIHIRACPVPHRGIHRLIYFLVIYFWGLKKRYRYRIHSPQELLVLQLFRGSSLSTSCGECQYANRRPVERVNS